MKIRAGRGRIRLYIVCQGRAERPENGKEDDQRGDNEDHVNGDTGGPLFQLLALPPREKGSRVRRVWLLHLQLLNKR